MVRAVVTFGGASVEGAGGVALGEERYREQPDESCDGESAQGVGTYLIRGVTRAEVSYLVLRDLSTGRGVWIDADGNFVTPMNRES